MLRPAIKTSAQLAEEYTKTLTPAQIAAADQEIYELGLSEPVLCCCEYSQASETTGGKHISHHLCDWGHFSEYAAAVFHLSWSVSNFY